MKIPEVIVILLNYNRAKDTIECIDSLNKVTYKNFKILLVDNKSTDRSNEIFKETYPYINSTPPEGLPEILHFIASDNLGYCGGTNYGMEEALKLNPEYIMLLNNDTIVEPDFLDHMVKEMELKKDVALSCSLIIAEHDRDTIWYGGGKLIRWRGLAIHLDEGKSRNTITDFEPSYVDFITGCVMLFRTEDLRNIGLQDERIFVFLDDILLSARAVNKGYKLLYVPKAVVYHKVLGAKESPFKLYYSVRNRLLLINDMNKGLLRLIASVYFLTVINLKLAYWKFKNPVFYHTAKVGLSDYFGKRFYKGRGMEFLNYK